MRRLRCEAMVVGPLKQNGLLCRCGNRAPHGKRICGTHRRGRTPGREPIVLPWDNFEKMRALQNAATILFAASGRSPSRYHDYKAERSEDDRWGAMRRVVYG